MNKSYLFCPHRLLLAQSLRKESEKLRAHIDEYQKRYEAQYEKTINELEEIRRRLNSDFEEAQKNILNYLSSDVETLQAISDSISIYVSTYFKRQLEYKKKEINEIQLILTNEFIGFLSAQMNEIGIEIDALRSRKEILSRKTDITDILRLIQLSGCVINIEGITDANDFLKKIVALMDSAYENERNEWYTLLSVQRILEERVTFLSEIQYISWVIEQKIQLSKELKNTRDIQYLQQKELLADIEQIKSRIESLSSILLMNSKNIRFFWARQIIFISAEIEYKRTSISDLREAISYYSDKKKSLYHDKEYLQHDIEEMKRERSHDSYKWDQLQSEKRNLSDEIANCKSEIVNSQFFIETLESEIKSLIARRTGWYNNRKKTQEIMWNFSVPLIRIGEKKQRDEDIFADIRLQELTAIVEEGKKAADLVYQSELEKLNAEMDMIRKERDHELSGINSKLENANTELQLSIDRLTSEKQDALMAARQRVTNIEMTLNEQHKKLYEATRLLSEIQSKDTRFILFRLFSDTPEETKAKAVVAEIKKRIEETKTELDFARKKVSETPYDDVPAIADAKKKVDDAQETLDQINEVLIRTQNSYDEKEAEIKKKIRELKPCPDRPTAEESYELEKIMTWLKSKDKFVETRGKITDECQN